MPAPTNSDSIYKSLTAKPNDPAQAFAVFLRIPGAKLADSRARRVNDSTELADVLLGGPDRTSVVELDFEREGASFRATVGQALSDPETVLPEAEILRVLPDQLRAGLHDAV